MDVERITDELKGVKPGKDFSVFLICLIIASVFWLLNALTKTYSTVIEIPITYVNIPSDKILSRVLPGKTNAEIKGSGFRLLSVTLFNTPEPIVIDYQKGNLRKGFKRFESSFGPDELRNQVMNDIPSEVSLGTISLDSLKMVVEEKTLWTVPVAADVIMEIEYPFFINGIIEVEPNEIEVAGANSIVNALDSIRTIQLDMGVANKRLVKDLELSFPNGVESTINQVRVKIPIDEYTEGQMEIPIKVTGLAKGQRLVLFPPSVKATYLVGLTQYENISEDDFLFEVDAKEITKGKTTLIVREKSTNKKIQLQDFKPHKVEFILKK
ncbi:MAG: hypothetical protein ACPGEG_08075 [Salibacteraceae bacterium]